MLFWCARGVVPLRRAALHFATASSRKHKACPKAQSKVLGQSENSVAILLSGYSFVSLRHETMASITDSIS